jgi:hypothetical protein
VKTLWQKAEEFSPTGIRTTTRGFRAVPPATDSLLYRGFFAAWIPVDPARYRPFETALLENQTRSSFLLGLSRPG